MSKPVLITSIVAATLAGIGLGYTIAALTAAPTIHECAQLFPAKGRFGAMIDIEVVGRPDAVDISSLETQLRGGSNRLLDDTRITNFLLCLEESAEIDRLTPG